MLLQFFACLVQKAFLQLDYRKLAALPFDASALATLITIRKTSCKRDSWNLSRLSNGSVNAAHNAACKRPPDGDSLTDIHARQARRAIPLSRLAGGAAGSSTQRARQAEARVRASYSRWMRARRARAIDSFFASRVSAPEPRNLRLRRCDGHSVFQLSKRWFSRKMLALAFDTL